MIDRQFSVEIEDGVFIAAFLLLAAVITAVVLSRSCGYEAEPPPRSTECSGSHLAFMHGDEVEAVVGNAPECAGPR